MEQFLEFISQAYVYIPASVIAVLAILIPAIVKIAKICTSNTANAVRIALLRKTVKELIEEVEGMQDSFIEDLENELNYYVSENAFLINKRQKMLNEQRITMIKSKLEKLNASKQRIEAKKEADAELENSKKKVRIKVIKKQAEEVMKETKVQK